MQTYRLTVEYEGTRYHGWQQQRNARTIAGELRRAIEGTSARIRELGGAGRTDAGVHALAQTAHLRLDRPVDQAAFRDEVNDLLPPDIHLLSVHPADERFHARHSAVSRSYLYQISRRRSAFAKRYIWWVRRSLDAERMAEASAMVRGRHDFALFCERPAEQTSTKVVVETAEVAANEALILVRLAASHFLWKMVRRLVGTLVEVGSGDLDLKAFAALLQGGSLPGRQDDPARWTAPPSGLFLERALYPGEPPLDAIAPVLAVRNETAFRSSSGSRPRPRGGAP